MINFLKEQDVQKFKTPAELLKFIEEHAIQFIDFNFNDMCGGWHHITQHVTTFDKDLIDRGIYFDGSSIKGWRKINESDMILKPDISKTTLDPFAAQTTLKIFCDVIEPNSGKSYNRDPRSIAKAAEAMIKSSGIADTAYFGPEAEFFIFDDVKVHTKPHHTSFLVNSVELPSNSGYDYETGNMAHRPKTGGGYVPEAPTDRHADIRAEMLTVLASMGVAVEKHHHEVAPAQHELGVVFSTLLESADNTQLYKHAVKNVAHAYGKTATFMPKPVFGENGSGMHVHQSLWKAGKPLFAGDQYAGLSDMALHYIGGIIKHAKSLNAFTNPSTNSYKRLIPGYEAPVLLAYSACNRSASCRIPFSQSPKGKRIEVRFPDPTANPYLAFASMVMAGLDGIENKIDPGKAMDEDLYHLEESKLAKIPTVCHSLRFALENLKSDHDFLLKGDVFSKDMIDAYIELKHEEVERFETAIHPTEYDMYYSS